MVLADSHRISRVPRYSGYYSSNNQHSYGAITRYGCTFQNTSEIYCSTKCSPTTPALPKQRWFGLFPLRSPLLRESLLFYFPPGTKMFQFSGFAPFGLPTSSGGVTPFGNLHLAGYLRLSVAYRSLSRPSSLSRAKASSICP
jgi:hypothetical protein